MLELIMITLFAVALFLVVYHHAIYPLMLKIMTKNKNRLNTVIKKRRYMFSTEDEKLNRFSIIIPAFNEAKFIAEKIRNLSFIDYPSDRYELILLCDGCQDDTHNIAVQTLAELACHDLQVQLINFKDNRGKVAALKEGVAKAKYDNIVFSDVSALLPVNSLLMLDSHFKNPKVGAVSGGYKFIEKGTAGEQCYWQYQSMVKSRESTLASVLGAHGAFYALRKSCYEEVPVDTINDDFLIPMNVIKQGYRVIYEPRVVAIELEHVNLEQDMRRRLRIAAGNFQQLVYLLPLLSPKYGWNAVNFASGKALRAVMPFIFVFIFISNIYLVPTHYFFLSILACQVSLYSLVMLINIFNISPKLNVLRVICYLVNGYWVALKGSLKYIFGLQEKIWTKT
ncbi:glycosyltransferase family 2 protein [Colwellia sp. 75C3]|uniref:glycosyltransferase family 2 protein n=1 Tax=Colwellia sp. 75C3 TaxID=888425 RepID=UPI000C34DFE2|nr:glycosyltransferase family 2 protein [Colwellia sp. 75C3]PKG80822.1 glycosyltransferase family 2 protein [Colwellia sp. 75C3]